MPKAEIEPNVESPWLDRREAAAYTKRSVRLVDEAAAAGELRKSGGGRGSRRVVFHRDWLDEWLAGRPPATVVAALILAALDLAPWN